MGCGGSSSAQAPSKPAPQPQASDPGLLSEDLEVVRATLNRFLCQGLWPPECVQAEARLRSGRQLPPDWDMRAYCAGRLLIGGMGGRKDSTVIAYQPMTQDVVRTVQILFDKTFRKVYTRDRRGCPIPDRFLVKEVNRVLNDQVWREYVQRREQIRQARAGQNLKVPDGLVTTNVVMMNNLGGLPPLDPQVNENWAFHGTTGEAASGIAENDFRLDFSGSNAGTLYGKGIYLAEHCTKSDEYGEGPKGPAGEQEEMGYEAPRPPPGPPPPLVRESYIMLCRSTLGRVNYNDEQRPNPDRLAKSCTSGEFDCVLGDRMKINRTFRELVVFNDDEVYPEFIVKYERMFFHEQFAGIYNQMLQRRNVGQFYGPTPQETQIMQAMWDVYAMPHKGRINKYQLLDLLMAVYQPPEDEEGDLQATFEEIDFKKDGWIDLDEFLREMTQRVTDGIACSGPEKFLEIYRNMQARFRSGSFQGIEAGEKGVLRMVWYQYANNAASIDKWKLLELLKAIGQPPANEHSDLDETFKEIDTKKDGVIDYDEFVQEIECRVRDGVGM